MNKTTTCKCGNKISLNEDIVTCKVCSTVYSNLGKMLISRHNWNVKDYFYYFEKNQSDQT